MSFSVVKNHDIPVRNFLQNLDLIFDLIKGMIRIQEQERKNEEKQILKILKNKIRVQMLLDSKFKLKPNQVVILTFINRNFTKLTKKNLDMFNYKSKQQLRDDFRKKLFTHKERSMCERVVEHSRPDGHNTTWKEAWLCADVEH